MFKNYGLNKKLALAKADFYSEKYMNHKGKVRRKKVTGNEELDDMNMKMLQFEDERKVMLDQPNT